MYNLERATVNVPRVVSSILSHLPLLHLIVLSDPEAHVSPTNL